MRAVIQRVRRAQVTIDGAIEASIKHGFLVLLGVTEVDTQEDADWLSSKIAGLRAFSDEAGAMNLNLDQVAGEVIVVSQFTLYASTKKGNRPSFLKAAKPEMAIPLYEYFVQMLKTKIQGKVGTGKFGADMQVELVNDGPVTLQIDTQHKE
ncbi:D-aminoacyl-tRNA deacylase [Croceiramulus getboli]|nr:D-aminoacyl-tRNA deacylase [Flavobacteriaceae bacterium YJPT1-3]